MAKTQMVITLASTEFDKPVVVIVDFHDSAGALQLLSEIKDSSEINNAFGVVKYEEIIAPQK